MRIFLALALVTYAGMAHAAESTPAPVTPAPTQPAATVSPGSAAFMGKHDKNAPIDIVSDNFTGDFQTKIGTYTGNVIVTQADYKLRADTVKVNYVENKPNRFDAAGHVVFASSSGVATGDNGIYDVGGSTVTLTGNVVLTKQKDVMRGTVLVVNTDTGQARLTAQGSPGNRVRALFVPSQQTSGQTAKKPAGGPDK